MGGELPSEGAEVEGVADEDEAGGGSGDAEVMGTEMEVSMSSSSLSASAGASGALSAASKTLLTVEIRQSSKKQGRLPLVPRQCVNRPRVNLDMLRSSWMRGDAKKKAAYEAVGGSFSSFKLEITIQCNECVHGKEDAPRKRREGA